MSDGRSKSLSVLYIGGASRSGSTVLAHLLAEAFGGVAVGELNGLWIRGPVENQLCNCGRQFDQCPFWSEVGRRAFGSWDVLTAQDIADFQEVNRLRAFPGLLIGKGVSFRWLGRDSPIMSKYTRAMERLYQAIREVADSNVIVESSKHPNQALGLGTAPSVRMNVIHLVRDPRGVAWSFAKKVIRPEVYTVSQLMPRQGASGAARLWLLYNAAFELVRIEGRSPLRLRYEDYSSAPAQAITRVGEYAALSPRRAFDGSRQISFTDSHSFGGNPVRFTDEKALPVLMDAEWQRKMPPNMRMKVTAITLPLLVKYGYRVGLDG